jgi:sensor histidine kinase regulating citrate/malate metabolism
MMKLSTKAYIIIILVLLQNMIGLLFLHERLYGYKELAKFDYSFVTYGVIVILSCSTIYLVGSIMRMIGEERKAILKLNHSQEVIHALHAQKHDFKNQLNVIGGMIQLDKAEKALAYIYKVADHADEGFSITKIANVELAATLYRKCVIAEGEGIQVNLDIGTSMEDLQMDSIHLCKIVFNLLDNAIDELKQCAKEEKILSIQIHEQKKYYTISIGNSYPVLPVELYDKIFEQGYTTKEGEGHGYGLATVKQIVQRYKGSIKVESSEEQGTRFMIRLPISTHTFTFVKKSIE